MDYHTCHTCHSLSRLIAHYYCVTYLINDLVISSIDINSCFEDQESQDHAFLHKPTLFVKKSQS